MRIVVFRFCLPLFLLLFANDLLSQKSEKLVVNGKVVKHIPRKNFDSQRTGSPCVREINRSYNGTCNNISNIVACEFGATDVPLERLFPNAYEDGISTLAGPFRPNPRSISNIIVHQNGDLPNSKNLSSLVFTWGQFLDHDISVTPEGGASAHADIPLPANEQTFTTAIEFKRSRVHPGTGVTNPREHTNLITAWIDGSNVYGSDKDRADWLRTFQDGKLKTSHGNLLPFNTVSAEANDIIGANAPSMAGDNGGTVVMFAAGDLRAVEQPGLTSLHTLFVREHNRLADELIAAGMTNDEEIYQTARKIVGAFLQKITFEDFLPALGIRLGGYTGYDPSINPNIATEFSTAAFRIGHTMVTNSLDLRDNDGNLTGSLALLEAFFNTDVLVNMGIEPILMGLSQQVQQEVDPFIVDNLRNFLFPIPGSPNAFGLDLASLNIQRGRDHGLPSYLETRESISCETILGFDQINSDPAISSRLREAYNDDLYAIDLWVGLLAEEKLNGSSFGPTMYTMLRNQFLALRDGDFYYYENDPALTGAQISMIKNTRLRDIIIRNTTIENMGSAFRVPNN